MTSNIPEDSNAVQRSVHQALLSHTYTRAEKAEQRHRKMDRVGTRVLLVLSRTAMDLGSTQTRHIRVSFKNMSDRGQE